MFQKSFSILFAVLLFGVCGGCYESTSSSRDGEDPDGRIDDWRMDDIRFDDPARPDYPPPPDAEIIYDSYPVDPPPPDVPPRCPPECTVVPTNGEIGAPCEINATCDYGATCITQTDAAYDGRIYTEFYQGACILYGAGVIGCDPEVPATCPSGSTCIYLFTYLGQEYYGCFDSCEKIDARANPYDYNCGCRAGYACDINLGVCFPGCSNDRECCERWWDVNYDGNRDDGEVVVKEGCTNTCDDGGLFSGGSPAPCSASFACINNGDPSNRWGGPCEGDAWCPPDGRCYDEYYYSDDPADPEFPGGYCVKDACNYVGRGCSDYGGACAMLEDPGGHYPTYECVGTCHFGGIPSDPDYECRKTPGQEQACIPVEPDFWYVPPMDGSDGYCWPRSFHLASGSIGFACRSDEDCDSPYGIGLCLELPDIAMSPFCSRFCNENAAVNYNICGGYVTGDAAGACFSGYCWDACDDPTAPIGANSCSQPSAMACYPTTMFGTSLYVGSGLAVPPGICIPACTSDDWCSLMWGVTMTCNRTTGVCE
jgi:hypothetical protein